MTSSETNDVRGELERRIYNYLSLSDPVSGKHLQHVLSIIDDARSEFPNIGTYDQQRGEGVFMFTNHCLAWAMKWLGRSTDSDRKIPILDSIKVEKTEKGERYIWTYHFEERA